jgi:hypothetical protein
MLVVTATQEDEAGVLNGWLYWKTMSQNKTKKSKQ